MMERSDDMIDTLIPLEEIRKEFENCSLLQHYDIDIVEFEEGNVLLKTIVQPHMLNTNGTLHGGIYASLIDTVFSMHLRSLTRTRCVTTNLNIYYTAPVKKGAVYAKASIISRGYKTAFLEGVLEDENNNVIAKGTGMFKIIRE